MRTIWKYTVPFPPHDRFTLQIPQGARMLRVEVQHDVPCLWMFVPDTDAPKVARTYTVIGTGHPISEAAGFYVGSFHLLDGDFVGHLFTDWSDTGAGA